MASSWRGLGTIVCVVKIAVASVPKSSSFKSSGSAAEAAGAPEAECAAEADGAEGAEDSTLRASFHTSKIPGISLALCEPCTPTRVAVALSSCLQLSRAHIYIYREREKERERERTMDPQTYESLADNRGVRMQMERKVYIYVYIHI